MHNRRHATKPPDISYKTWAAKSITVFSNSRIKLTISWNTIKKLIEGEKERVSKIELERHFGLIRMQIIKFPYLHNHLWWLWRNSKNCFKDVRRGQNWCSNLCMFLSRFKIRQTNGITSRSKSYNSGIFPCVTSLLWMSYIIIIHFKKLSVSPKLLCWQDCLVSDRVLIELRGSRRWAHFLRIIQWSIVQAQQILIHNFSADIQYSMAPGLIQIFVYGIRRDITTINIHKVRRLFNVKPKFLHSHQLNSLKITSSWPSFA